MAHRKKICCLCGKEFKEKGNNPFSVDKEKGHVCCDSCAYKVVVPARMKMMMSRAASAAKNG